MFSLHDSQQDTCFLVFSLFYLVSHFLLNAGKLNLSLFSQLFKCIELFLWPDDIMKMIIMMRINDCGTKNDYRMLMM